MQSSLYFTLFNHFLVLYLFLISFTFASNLQVFPPRGVSLTKQIFYDKTRDFTCLDGSKSINFQLVNDDYCDCPDSSDEPGTSACPNGIFHCTNAGYRPLNIPSSRVNDGICDCCDGSDEWKSHGLCTNSCVELWRQEKEILKEQQAAANQGFLLRQEYSKSGLQKKTEREEKLKELEVELGVVKEKEALILTDKEGIEALETTLKEEHQKKVDAIKAEQMNQDNIKRGTEAFLEMDTDKDGMVSVAELVVYTEIDPNNEDGEFTLEEGKEVLLEDIVDLNQFLDKTWPSISSMFITKLEMTQEEIEERKSEVDEENVNDQEAREEEEYRREQEEEEEEEEEWEGDEEEFDEDEDEDYEEEDIEDQETAASSSSSSEGELEYDDITRSAVDDANRIREEFKDHQDKKKRIEDEIASINKNLGLDYGPDHAFQVLEGQCFELSTLEYKYKFCPYDRTAQQPKNGGSETSLGKWVSWSGIGNKYLSMKYENGLGCWNGPSRSTEVKLSCGIEHKLISVDEPSRCAYVFEFSTPCMCHQINNDAVDQLLRDEL